MERACYLSVVVISALFLGCTGVSQTSIGDTPADSASVLVAPSATTMAVGTAVKVNVTVNGPNTSNAWTLSATNLPAGVTASFTPDTVAEGSTAELSLLADTSAPVGMTAFTVVAANAAGSHSAQATLTLTAMAVGPSVGVLVNGVPSRILAATGAQSMSFALAVPAGARNLRIETSGFGDGALTLLTKFGAMASDSSFDCKQYGTTGAGCDVASPRVGVYSVTVVGAPEFSNVTVTGSFELPGTDAGSGGGTGGGSGGGTAGGTGGGSGGGTAGGTGGGSGGGTAGGTGGGSGGGTAGGTGGGSGGGTAGGTGGGSGGGTAGGAGGGTGGGTAGGTGGGTGGTGVGAHGGTVGLMHFAMTGDTRPPACEDTANYPSGIINSIADAATLHHAQFGLDLGDHMYVCNNSLQTATDQMNLYMNAVHRFAGPWFMTMGNHECYHGPCLLGSTQANYVAFLSALAPISPKPYYSFNVETSLGRATFVVIADNGWDSVQQSWLEATLTDADAHARYTIVMRHHPEGDTSVATNPVSMAIVRQHKFAALLTGHNHSFSHQTTDQGRDVVMGLGGAPLLAAGVTYNGYAMVDQLADGRLQFTVRAVSGDTVQSTWTVGPNQ